MAVGATAAAGDGDSIFNGKLIFVAVFRVPEQARVVGKSAAPDGFPKG